MKFEFVEFYPVKDKKLKKLVGTVHIYAIDCELDIRGIRVFKHGNGIHFNFPHFKAVDSETNEEVTYPFIRWTNASTHKIMMDWLKNEIGPEIMKRIEK